MYIAIAPFPAAVQASVLRHSTQHINDNCDAMQQKLQLW
jgi:hypothetical protein